MKRYLLAIIGITTLVGCKQASNNSEQTPTSAETEQPKEVTVVRKTIPYVGDFTNITNVSDFDIVFTEGDYSIEVEAPETVIGALRTSIDSGVITFGQLEEGKNRYLHKDSKGVGTIYVSCPELRVLAVCGKGNFKSEGCIHTSYLHAGVLDLGNIDIDSVVCETTFRYETTYNGDASFGYVSTGSDALIFQSMAGTITANMNVGGALVLNTASTGEAHITATAHQADVVALDDSRCTLDLRTDNLLLSAQGTSLVNLKGNIKHKDIKVGKRAKVLQL